MSKWSRAEYVEMHGHEDRELPDWLPCLTPHCYGAYRYLCSKCETYFWVCACGCGGRECECGEMKGE